MELQKTQVLQRLHTHFIKVDSEWFNECVEYFVETNPYITIPDLYEKTFEQWKLSDIADVGLGCLPDTINNEGLVHLNGNFVLQMQFVIDIAEPAYDQLRRLYNQKLDQTETETTETKKQETKKKRSLKLELTDGHRTIVAMEYAPIACLHTKLLPGCKLLLTGPLRCINKVILLEPGHVKLLGGEVGKFEIDNAFENVLLKALGRPINPNPKTEYVEQPVTEEPRKSHNIAALQEQHRLSQREKSVSAVVNQSADIFGDDDMLFDMIETDFDSIPSSPQPPTRRAKPTNDPNPVVAVNHHVNLLDDDDEFDNILESLPAVTLQNQPTPFSENFETNHDPIDHDAEEFERQCYEPHQPSPPPPKPQPKSIVDADYPYKIRGCHLVSIAQLNAFTPDSAKLDRIFMIKGNLQNVFDRLQVKRSSWTIGVEVTDSSVGMLRLRFGDDLLNKLTNSSAAEVTEMRKRAKSMPQLVEQITEILDNLKRGLENLNCFIKIQFVRNEDSGRVADAANGLELIESAPFLERILANQLRDSEL